MAWAEPRGRALPPDDPHVDDDDDSAIRVLRALLGTDDDVTCVAWPPDRTDLIDVIEALFSER